MWFIHLLISKDSFKLLYLSNVYLYPTLFFDYNCFVIIVNNLIYSSGSKLSYSCVRFPMFILNCLFKNYVVSGVFPSCFFLICKYSEGKERYYKPHPHSKFLPILSFLRLVIRLDPICSGFGTSISIFLIIINLERTIYITTFWLQLL